MIGLNTKLESPLGDVGVSELASLCRPSVCKQVLDSTYPVISNIDGGSKQEFVLLKASILLLDWDKGLTLSSEREREVITDQVAKSL